MKYTDQTQLKLEQKNHILWITLNNPETSNSISYEMIDSIVDSLARAESDNHIRCVVITGEGKNFCSGGDLNNMLNKAEMFQGESNELKRRYEFGIQRISKSLEAFTKPTIALVQGAAAGAGCDLACMCDLRVGTPQAKFLESFVKIGLVPGDGGSFFLQRVVGFARAMEMTLTARAVEAEEALKIGLLNKIVDAENIKAEVEKLAEHISSLPPIAVQMSKKAVKISYQHDLNVSLDLLAAYQGITQRTHDHDEALQAATQKRKAEFKNK